MTKFSDNFHANIDTLVQSKALSKTGVGRFKSLIDEIANHLSIAKDQVYVVSCARPNNLNIRLTQGAAQHRHNVFGLGVIPNPKKDTVKGGLKAAKSFIGPGNAQYDAVGVAVVENGRWVISGIVEAAGSGIANKFSLDFPNLVVETVVQNSPAPPTATTTQPLLGGDSRFSLRFQIAEEERKPRSNLPVQVLIHGCPGSGKSFEAVEWAKTVSKYATVVFHPETTYSDFVGVFRPFPVYKITNDKFITSSGDFFTDGEPFITYRFVAGPLLEAYCYAIANPNDSVAIIIEELSRANASLVFGDMLQLLDRVTDGVDTGKSTYEIYPKAEIQEFLHRYGVNNNAHGSMRFPANLHIWATMNRSDQNARQIDTAFLRRWTKRHMSFNLPCVYGSAKVSCPNNIEIEWDELRSKINGRLVEFVPEDKFIGPYFLSKSSLSSVTTVAEDLLSYLWNDVLKTRSKEFFVFQTLSEVISAWQAGSTNPFRNIELN